MSAQAEELMSVDEAFAALGLNGAPREDLEIVGRTLSNLGRMLEAADGEARVLSMAHAMVREMGLHPFVVAMRLSAYLVLLNAAPRC